MAVFIFLCIELVFVAILVLPFPRSFRNTLARAIRRLNLGPRVRFASQWIMFALVAAFVESVSTLRRLEEREGAPAGAHAGAAGFDARTGYVEMSIEKQRKFRAERNMYLAGFALTLLFVIARIVELMQESVGFEEERDVAKKRLDDVASMGGNVTDIPSEDAASGLRQRAGAKTE